MRNVYLIRHGEPEFPGGRRMCLGLTDLPLSTLGALQAALAGLSLPRAEAVFCSFLARSRQSAAFIDAPVRVLPGLEELSPGEWDGLTFEEIRLRWGELYARRGEDPSVQPPGAEAPAAGLRRFVSAMDSALSAVPGDIAVVSHSSVMQLYICRALGRDMSEARSIRLPYGSVTRLVFDGGDMPAAAETGETPLPFPDERVCRALLRAADTPESTADHCAAVAKEAMRIVCALAARGVCLDADDIFAAAYLHDIARAQDDHAARGAELIRALGYERAADMIAQHHDLRDSSAIDGAAVVYIADKTVKGTEKVSLAARFGASRAKCASPEALAANARRFGAARAVGGNINTICARPVVSLSDD